MSYTQICNAPWMFVWVTILLLAVVFQCLIYMKHEKSVETRAVAGA